MVVDEVPAVRPHNASSMTFSPVEAAWPVQYTNGQTEISVTS